MINIYGLGEGKNFFFLKDDWKEEKKMRNKKLEVLW